MSIFGIGIDLVDVARIADAMTRGGDAFQNRLFTAREQDYCRSQADSTQHFAARFAAKEAVMKALGRGYGQGSDFNEIEVVRADDGRPTIQLHGATKRTADSLRISRILISLAHTSTQATAYALAECDSLPN